MEVYSIFTVDVAPIKNIFGKYSCLQKGIKGGSTSFIPFLLQLFFLTSILLLLSFSCKKNQNTHRLDYHEKATYSTQNYSDLKLDSVNVVDFLNHFPMSDSIQNHLAQFYTYRNFNYAWINKNGLTLAATNFYDQLHADSQIFSDKSLINNSLDSLFIAANADEKKFMNQPRSIEQLELLLTATFFKYAEKVYGGATSSTRKLDWFIPRKKKNYLVLLDSLVSNNTENKIQEPVNEYYTRLKEKLQIYRNIQQKGGFAKIEKPKTIAKIGDSANYILQIIIPTFLH
jgi:L,D-transpeptidase YcbB